MDCNRHGMGWDGKPGICCIHPPPTTTAGKSPYTHLPYPPTFCTLAQHGMGIQAAPAQPQAARLSRGPSTTRAILSMICPFEVPEERRGEWWWGDAGGVLGGERRMKSRFWAELTCLLIRSRHTPDRPVGGNVLNVVVVPRPGQVRARNRCIARQLCPPLPSAHSARLAVLEIIVVVFFLK